MLQQTRVATVEPYYQRFLRRFPDLHALAAAPEEDLLAAWAGLGYYSRARNLQRAARSMNGEFPRTHEAIRALPGVGDYTAAAVASIAFHLPHVAVDGNVLRVTARLRNDCGDVASAPVRSRLAQFAQELLDARAPGDFNQAMMELGATVCTPREPRCLLCPVSQFCQAVRAGTQDRLPVKSRRAETIAENRTALIIRQNGKVLLWQRPAGSARLAGFWELPEPGHFRHAPAGNHIGAFRHSITHHRYVFDVILVSPPPPGLARLCKDDVAWRWMQWGSSVNLALSSTARKALAILDGLEPNTK